MRRMTEYIDVNKKVTIQVYDDMTEEWKNIKNMEKMFFRDLFTGKYGKSC